MLTKIINRLTGLLIVSILLILTLYLSTCFGLPSSKLISVKYNQTLNVESIELLFDNNPDYLTFNLKNPDRFVLDIKNCYFPKVRGVIEADSTYIKKIRISQFRHDRVRLVIDQKETISFYVKKRDSFNGMVLSLSIQLPAEFAPVEKNVKPLMTFEPSEIKEIEVPIESENQSTEIKNVVKIREDAIPDIIPYTSDENLNTLFSVSEESVGAMPDIVPNVPVMENQPDVITEPSKFFIGGDLRNETAYRITSPHHFSKIKNTLNLKASGKIFSSSSYVIGTRLSYDAVYDVNNEYNTIVEDDQKTTADLRDAYLDLGVGNFDFRLGNQQIVWGQAVGLFFADIVNPKDLREFILPDLDQVRIPVLAANMEYYYNSFYFQMIFIPFPKFNEFGKHGSEFDFSKSLYSQDADIILNNPLEPSNSLDHSEVGFRLSKLTDGWDMSIFYLYDVSNFSVNYRTISLNPGGSLYPVTITYNPQYERMHRIGSTFSKDYKDAIFKGEFIYSNKMFFQSSDISDPDGIEKSDTFDWLLGVDYTVLNSLETNFQLMQSIILEHENSMTQHEVTTSFSVWLKTGFFSDLIEPEIFFVSSLNQRDSLLRPKVAFNYGARLKLILGGDIFYGESNGTFGMFDENDRIYIEMLYNF